MSNVGIKNLIRLMSVKEVYPFLGNMLDAAGNRTSFTYDSSSGRRTEVINPFSKKVIYTYNSRGQILTIRGDTDYPVDYVYDNYGRMTQLKTYRDANLENPDITTWNYQASTGLLTSKTYADSNPFRFSSEYFDQETGLIYYNYRYYSPELGRWLSRDTIEEKGGLNLYGFCFNNSINKRDIYGLQVCHPRNITFTPCSREGEKTRVCCTDSTGVWPCNKWFICCQYLRCEQEAGIVGIEHERRYTWHPNGFQCTKPSANCNPDPPPNPVNF